MTVKKKNKTQYNQPIRHNLEPLVWLVILYSMILITGQIVNTQITNRNYFGSFAITLNNDFSIEYYQQGTETEKQCSQKLNQIVTGYQSTCKNCQITINKCTQQFNNKTDDILGESPINFPSSRTTDFGVILYKSNNLDIAQDACRQAANNSNLLNCHKAGEQRQLDNLKPGENSEHQRVDRITLYIIGITLSATIILTILSKTTEFKTNQNRILTGMFIASIDLAGILLSYLIIGLPNKENYAQLLSYEPTQIELQFILSTLAIVWLWIKYEHYSKRKPWWDEVHDIVKSIALITLISASTLFYTKTDTLRSLNVLSWGTCLILLPTGRIISKRLLSILNVWHIDAVIIGYGKNAIAAHKAIESEFSLGYRTIGFVKLTDNDCMEPNESYAEKNNIAVYQEKKDLEQLISKLQYPQIIIALDEANHLENDLVTQLISKTKGNFHIIPHLKGIPLTGASISHFYKHEIAFITTRKKLNKTTSTIIKRTFDLFLATTGIITLLPLLTAIALIIKTKGGPIFYFHKRVGQNGKTFHCIKFRTMYQDSANRLSELLNSCPTSRAEWETNFKLSKDPRITPIGRFLRKTSLDELPQLINVIKGDMSLVGPRPIIEEELKKYGNSKEHYLSALPGITGLWQTSGRNNTTYEERVALDAWYAQNWSLWYDIVIIFKTFTVVFSTKGAY